MGDNILNSLLTFMETEKVSESRKLEIVTKKTGSITIT